MAPAYIFARDVQKLLNQGKREIEAKEGARFSLAALDLIRDNGISIVPPHFSVEASEAAPSMVQAPGEKPRPASEASADIPGPEISPEQLEQIADRVIARLNELRHGKPPDEKKRRAADDDLIVCRCEEITVSEIKEAIRNGMRTLNGIKRVTRAGMGLCQGQTCQRLVARILSEELGIGPERIDATTARAPVRPVPMAVFATTA